VGRGEAAAARPRNLDADNTFTAAGRAEREWVEEQTDAAAGAPYEHLGEAKTQRLLELVKPWSKSMTKQIFG